MRREIFYDEYNEVWRSTQAFGIIDDGVYVDDFRHRLKICKEKKYREFDLLNFCRDFKKSFCFAPNIIRANETGIKSISEKKYNESEKTFEIAEFKMKVEILDPEVRDDFWKLHINEIDYTDTEQIYSQM